MCGGLDSCTECVDGLYLFYGKCYNVCPDGTFGQSVDVAGVIVLQCMVDPCVHYITVGNCAICVAPYLVYNGTCVTDCPSGMYKSEL